MENKYIFYKEKEKMASFGIINNKKYLNDCVFCDIINKGFGEPKRDYVLFDKKDGHLLMLNDFQTYSNCRMYLVLEFSTCEKYIMDYSAEEFKSLAKFLLKSIDKVMDLTKSEYKDIMVFRQNGQTSGSSVKHGHIQIVAIDEELNHETILSDLNGGIELFRKDNFSIRYNNEAKFEGENFIFKFKDDIDIGYLTDKIKECHKYFSEGNVRFLENFSFSYHKYGEYTYLRLLPRKVLTTTTYHFDTYIKTIKDIDVLIERLKATQ